MDVSFPPPAMAWTLVFCLLLVTNLMARLWLTSRQLRHVLHHRAAVPKAFAERVDLAAHQKAADYTVAKGRLDLLDTGWSTALLVAWTLLGGLEALNQALGTVLGGMWQQLALLAAFFTLSSLLELPLAWARTFRIEERFGFNRSSLRLWLADGLKSALLGALIGLPLAALVMWLMEAAGPRWWLWAWGAWMGFNLMLLVLYPTLIAPLFNRFEPLQDPDQKARIEGLLQRCGFQAKGLFVMDGSKRSGHANAYFTGFGAAKRVVFFDTLLQQLAPTELEAVLAHELGHYRHGHLIQRLGWMFALSLAGFATLGWLSGQAWFYLGLGVTPRLDAPNSALALILFVCAAPLLTFFMAPLLGALSRRHEFQADAYAAAQTAGPDLASALLKLTRDNASTLTPDPWFVRFHYSHPPAAERLARLQP
jgi:STE24 endopeptidase